MKRVLDARMLVGMAASGALAIAVRPDLTGLVGAATVVAALGWLAGQATVYRTLWERVLPRLNEQQIRDIVAIAERER